MKTDILAILQRLTPWRLWALSVVLAVMLTEAVVSVMGLLLKGKIPLDYLLTGLMASLFAASVVTALLDILFKSMRESVIERAQSAEEIADLFHHAPCGYHSLDKDGIFQKINDTELAWLCYERDEVIGKMKWTDLLAPAGIQTFRETFPQLMARGFIHDLEIEITRKDGTIFTGLVNATAIYDPGGNFVLSRSTVMDITARKLMEAALRKSEERARLAISASHLALWDYDLATGGVYLSEGWSQLLGGKQQPTFTTIQELTGLVPEEEQHRVRAAILEAVKGHVSSSYQVTHRARKLDGGYIWVLSEGRVIERGQDGRALRMIGTNRDITERKLTGEKLRKSEVKLQAILDNLPYLTWLKGNDGRYLKVNKSYADYVRLKDPGQAIGKTDFDFWPKELAEKYRAEDAIVMAERRQRCIEEPSLDGDRIHWVETFKTPIIDADGKMLGTAGFVRDITERKQAEQALRQQRNFIRLIIDTAPNMISVKDAEDKFLLVNRAMAAMHGKSPEEMIGQSGAEQFRNKEDFEPILRADREVIEKQCKVELVAHDSRNGKERWFHITKVPMRQPDGTVHVLGIGVDITEKRFAEQQMRELNSRIQAVREEEKTRIARDIHDDLGGTLTALKMETHGLDANCAGCKDAVPMFERLKAMSQLLDNAASATRRVITDLHPTILDDLGMKAALEWQSGQFYKRTGIECRCVCTKDDDCKTELDKIHALNLFRIFQEALTNVTRHSGASRVEVEFHHGEEIILSIRDNGCGLPEGHTIASTSYGMRGMTERVKQLGGKIEFDSKPGGGLAVTVRLSSRFAFSLERAEP